MVIRRTLPSNRNQALYGVARTRAIELQAAATLPAHTLMTRAGLATAAVAVSAAATAVWVERRSRRAEREHPPTGKFIDVDGVCLHYVEKGEGPPVVLVHGNALSLVDFQASGLFDRLAAHHRVIAFDRPGFGHSTRPRDRLWTPAAQAELLYAALALLGVERPAIVGHSMGATVAVAWALAHPDDVRSLVLLAGYYYPTLRVDALLTAPVALPVLGDAMRYTVTALSARALLGPMMKATFAPRDIPPDFFPRLSREMLLRPSQLRASAEDAAFMMPSAAGLADRFGELRLPVTIYAGADDKVVAAAQAERLHRDVPQSELVVLPGVGHMVHYAAPERIAAALAGG